MDNLNNLVDKYIKMIHPDGSVIDKLELRSKLRLLALEAQLEIIQELK